MIYFTSDTHGFHKNICRGTSEWDLNKALSGSSHQKTRDFDTIEQMNTAIINDINNLVKEDDELWHLGDWTFGGLDKIWEFRKQIKCRNIHLIYGNHDHHIENNKKVIVIESNPNNVNLIFPRKFQSNGSTMEFYLQDLFSSCQYYKELKINGRMFILSHYAHRVWNHSHKGTIHLYGHSHGTLENTPWGKSMDVGIDNAFKLLGEYRPFSITEIIDIMDKRETLILDHHNQNTN